MDESGITAGKARTEKRWHWVFVIVVFAASLMLRLNQLELFLAGDETKWVCRGINFSSAIREGRWADTYQAEHPGVVTMWITTLALPLDSVGDWVFWCDDMGGNKLTRVDNNETLLALPGHIAEARRLLTICVWGGTVVAYLLVRKLFGWRSALWAAIALALDPFYLALSRVLHLDAVLSTCMLVSALALLVYVMRERPRWALALSALAGGLAMANKTPGLFVGGWAALLFVGEAWMGESDGRLQRLRRALVELAVWGALALGLVVVLWPTLWVDARNAISQVLGSAIGYAESGHGNGNFFWHKICADPGPAFYPVAWAFRTTPLVMLGLVGLLVGRKDAKWRERRALIWLGAYALLYVAFMTAGAKKFDRYGLPAFVMVDVLAAIGLARWAGWLSRRFSWPNWAGTLGCAVVLALHITLITAAFPYGFSYYNPVLGGIQGASDILLIGWGEGMEGAADWLNAQEDAESFHVNTAHISQLAPFFVGHTSSASELDLGESDYYVFYSNTIQRLREPEVLTRFYGQVEPVHVVEAYGFDYVYIYRNHLLDPAREWIETEADPERDVVVVNIDSAIRRQYSGPVEIEKLNGMAGRDRLVREINEMARRYDRLAYLTFDEVPGDPRGQIAELLSQCATVEDSLAWDGMKLMTYVFDEDVLLGIPTPEEELDARFGSTIDLRGYDVSSDTEGLDVTLYWRTVERLETDYTVFMHVLDADGNMLAQHDGQPGGGGAPTTSWYQDETVVDEHRITWADPADAQRAAQIVCGLYDGATGQRLPAATGMGLEYVDARVPLATDLAERLANRD